MTITMFDSVNIDLLPAGYSYAGYVNGIYANYTAIKGRFLQSDVLSITVNSAANADCLDIETGDASPESAAAWVARQAPLGVTRPCLYADASTMIQVIDAMKAAGVARSTLRLWSAHYTGEAHICGPSSCGALPEDADGTQWTDNANGLDLDESLLLDDFFGGTVPPVTYSSVTGSLPVLTGGMNDADLPHWYVRRAQAVLNAVYGAQLTVDGAYGPATAAAVKAVQAHYGLTQDSACGALTWAKLIAG
jgi:hypothetical protein